MVLYKDKKCPVCNEVFKEDDDIVTCPVCGTPHHRECYKSLGRCANLDLHKTEFSFLRDDKETAKPEAEKHDEKKAVHEAAGEGVRNIAESSAAQPDEEMIDGVAISDIYDYVGVNQHKFIPKFRRNKKFSWNWCALFFGPLYMFYRKMYLDGMMFFSLKMLVNYALSAVFAKEMEVAQNFMTEFANTADMASLNAFAATKEFKILIISNVIVLLIDVAGALLVDWLYRRKVINSIKLFDTKMKELASEKYEHLSEMREGLDTVEGRKAYIKDSGGVSLFAPIALIALSAGYMIMSSMG